jgi:putative acetyltransferase
MRPDLQVKATLLADRAAVVAVVQLAFGTAGRDGQEEVEIVQAVWTLDAAAEGLDLVATVDEAVVGHVLGSWGTLGGRPVIGVAPLAISPDYQRTGIATALMREMIRRADSSGLPVIVLLGDPAYYQWKCQVEMAPL